MKRDFTKLFLIAAFALGYMTDGYAQCDPPIPAPEGSLFSWQFDGGLDGWTATNLDGEDVDQTATLPTASEGTVFGWVWDADGRVAGGSFNDGNDGATEAIQSESVCNGAMVFNSDFYDNRGVEEFESGVCPANCNGLLNSPVIDLSAFDTEVDLVFEQALRQFQSEYYVLLSIDGGMSYYDTLEINADFPLNSNHFMNETLSVPLCGAKGQSEFQFSIWYVGNYYYWAIDDVRILPTTQTDVRVNDNFAAISPTFGQPFNMGFDIPFLADIENVSTIEAIAPTLAVSVLDGANLLHSQERVYDNVPACRTDENKPFPELFTMPDEVGVYNVSYLIDEPTDVNITNDTVTGEFIMTDRDFRKARSEEEVGMEYLDGWRPGGASNFLSWGSYFYMPDNDLNQSIESVETGIVFGRDEMPNSGNITIAVYQWVDLNGDGTVNSGDFEEKTKLGEASQIVLPGDAPGDFRNLVLVPLTDEGELIRPQVDPNNPEAGIQLLVMVHSNPFSTDINYFSLGFLGGDRVSESANASVLAYEELGVTPRYGSFQGSGASGDDADEERDYVQAQPNYYVNMKLDPLTSVNEINESLDVKVFPSPATTEINVDLNLEELSESVIIDLVNMAGSTVGSFSFKNVKEDRLNVDVSRFAGGMYLMNIRTNAGMISKKVSIVH